MNLTRYVSTLTIPDADLALWVLERSLRNITQTEAGELYDMLFLELPDELVRKYVGYHREIKETIQGVLNVVNALPPAHYQIATSLSCLQGKDYVVNLEVRH